MATSEQHDLNARDDLCTVDPEALASIGRAPGHQVRVSPSFDRGVFAVYTVSETPEEATWNIIRMGRSGRLRLGSAEPFEATVDSVVPRPSIGDAEAVRLHEFVERLHDNGTHRGLIAAAPHGGDIERHTDVQAERVAERLAEYGVSVWGCKGFAPPGVAARRLFHIASTEIHEACFPGLGAVIGRGFRHAVAFHGAAHEEVLVGGGAAFRLKAEIASAIEIALSGSRLEVRIAGREDVLGASPQNLVNRLTASGRGGIDLQQGDRARHDHGLAIADAVAEVFACRLQRQPSTGRRPWRRPSRWSRG